MRFQGPINWSVDVLYSICLHQHVNSLLELFSNGAVSAYLSPLDTCPIFLELHLRVGLTE